MDQKPRDIGDIETLLICDDYERYCRDLAIIGKAVVLVSADGVARYVPPEEWLEVKEPEKP